MPAKYKYIYFNVYGRGQGIKYIFAVGKLPYEDQVVEFSEWPELKKDQPLGFLPTLEVGGKKISQGLAISRYVAKEAKLYGSNPLEQGLIDMVVDTANDIRESFFPLFFKHLTGEPRDNLLKGAKATLANLSKILGEKEYFVNKLSFADIHFYHCMEIVISILEQCEVDSKLLDEQPKLKKLFERVGNNPEIKKVKAKYPDMPVLIPRPAPPK